MLGLQTLEKMMQDQDMRLMLQKNKRLIKITMLYRKTVLSRSDYDNNTEVRIYDFETGNPSPGALDANVASDV